MIGIRSDPTALTPRELDVLRARAGGLSMKQTCELLHISVQTGRNHLAAVYGKLNTRGVIGALNRARELGLVE